MIWIILGVTLVLIIILLSRIYIEFHYIYQSKQQVLRMKLSLYRVRLFKKEINLSDKEPTNSFDDLNVDNFIDKIKELIQMLHSFHSAVILLLRKINIHCLHWTTHVGTGDAATTGMAAGALWGVKGGFIGFITEKGRLYVEPDIRVIPHYEQRCLHSQIDCIVSIQIGQAIHAFLTLGKLLSSKKVHI